jgi:hypothetical protein
VLPAPDTYKREAEGIPGNVRWAPGACASTHSLWQDATLRGPAKLTQAVPLDRVPPRSARCEGECFAPELNRSGRVSASS